MRKRTRLLISVSALVIMIGAIFLAGKPELSSAQRGGFRSYQFLVFCGNSEAPTATFWHDVQERPSFGLWPICAGKCGGGTVSLKDALAGIPAPVQAALRTQVENAPAGKVGCVAGGSDGKEPLTKETKPEKRDGTNPPPESPVPDSSVGSAATGDDFVEVTIRCPFNTYTDNINWRKSLDGSYSDTGGQIGKLDFEITHGANAVEVPFKYIRRVGQKIECNYSAGGGLGLTASYAAKFEKSPSTPKSISDGVKTPL